MRFELTEALLDDILFSMEDQNGEFLLDTREAMIVSMENDDFFDPEDADEKNEDGEDRYISLPGWSPAEGFRLMEHFTAALRNSAVREELSSALNRGKGVFRAYKDTLSQYPETEKLWFNYKEREMKREVIAWYNALRESWGMELIGSEPEETEGLVLEDFRFREAKEEDRDAAAGLHRICGEAYGEFFARMNQWVFPGGICLAAETAGGEFAAYISAVFEQPSLLRICALEVSPRYRGLGLGEALLARLLEQAGHTGVSQISIDLPAETENFARVLIRESFQPRVTRYCRNTAR